MNKEKVKSVEVTLDNGKGVLNFKINDENFKHYYRAHDEDDLCCRIQNKYDMCSDMFYDLWYLIKEEFDNLKRGKCIIW